MADPSIAPATMAEYVPPQAPTTYDAPEVAAPPKASPTGRGVFPNIPSTYNPKNVEETKQLVQDMLHPKTSAGARLAAGAVGAGNNILFGIPGAIANIATGKKDTLENAVTGSDTSGELAKSYNLGKVFGMGGNLAIGGGGAALAKLAKAGSTAAKLGGAAAAITSPTTLLGKALAAGGAKALGEGLQTLGTTGSAIGTGVKAALDSGTIQAIAEVGQKDPSWADHVLTASLIGGGVGLGAGMVGKAVSKVSPVALEQASTDANKTYLSTAMGVKKPDFKFALKNSSQSEASVDDMVNNATKTAQKYAVQNGLDAKQLLQKVGDTYQIANKAYDSSGVVPSQVLGPKLESDPVIQKFILDHPDQGPQFIKSVMGALDGAAGDASAQRQILNAEWINGQKATMGPRAPLGSNAADVIGFTQDTGPVATAIKTHLDNTVMDIAQQAGIDTAAQTGLALNQAKEIYGAFTPIRHALARQAMTVNPLMQGDSGTALSLLLSGAVSGSGIGPLLAVGGSKLIQSAARGVVNQVAMETSPVMAKGLLAASKSPIPGVISKTGQALNAAAPALGRYASQRAMTGENSPTSVPLIPGGPSSVPSGQIQNVSNPPQAQVVTDLLENDITNPSYQDKVNQGLQRQWFEMTKGVGAAGQPNAQNPIYVQWAQGVLGAMTTNGKIDPRKIAPLLYATQDQADLYRGYNDTKQMISSLGQQSLGATGLGNLGGALNPKAVSAKQGVIAAVEKLAGKPAAGEVSTYMLLHGVANPAALWAHIDQVLRKYRPQISEVLTGVGQ